MLRVSATGPPLLRRSSLTLDSTPALVVLNALLRLERAVPRDVRELRKVASRWVWYGPSIVTASVGLLQAPPIWPT
jgi:hypothetical protein